MHWILPVAALTVAGCTSLSWKTYPAEITIEPHDEEYVVMLSNPYDQKLCLSAGTLPGPNGYVAASSDAPELVHGDLRYQYKKKGSGYNYQPKPQELDAGDIVVFKLLMEDFKEFPAEASLSFSPKFVECRLFER